MSRDGAPQRRRWRRRSLVALLPAALTSAALVAAPFAGTTTAPLTAQTTKLPAASTSGYLVTPR